ncbi:DUF2589 domain-containing protein [Halorubrum rubrum]|uniref:DUF2589 domain-containing protein n=1 Tax=Halorubrum rubrum TaxID=1126240 RepID=A0ABD5R5D8_9EURY|nr:DUF2589 domain-containing protein [Halorubrum rubrum]
MSQTDTLADLPLATLFSAPLIAAIDASAQAQTETIDLLREVGFESDGTPATVSFEYATTDVEPATGERRRRPKTLEVPLLLFLSVPELVVHEIEQTFSARIVDVEDVEREGDGGGGTAGRTKSPSLRPQRLRVAPAKQSETFARRTKTTFDLDVTMRAEVENRSTGIDLLERSLMTTVVDGDSEAAGSTPAGREKAKREAAKREKAKRERAEEDPQRTEDRTTEGDGE